MQFVTQRKRSSVSEIFGDDLSLKGQRKCSSSLGLNDLVAELLDKLISLNPKNLGESYLRTGSVPASPNFLAERSSPTRRNLFPCR